MKLVFAGTPDFAAVSLRRLIAAGHEIVLVFTQPDRPAGRGLQVHPTPVKAVASAHGIPVLQPKGLRLGGRHDTDARAAQERLVAVRHDAMVVAAYGLILPKTMLTNAPLGCINIHASLLPRWRGAAPIQRAIEAGDLETGVTIMQMDEGLDTGPVLSTHPIVIAPQDTAATLTDKLAALGGDAIVEALAALETGSPTSRPQHMPGDESQVTYAAKLSKAEAPLDFTLDAKTLVDRIRAFDPWPGCSAQLFDDAAGESASFKVWKAEVVSHRPGDTPSTEPIAPGRVLRYADGVIVATGRGAIALLELQKPGGKRLPASLFVQDFVGRSSLRFQSA